LRIQSRELALELQIWSTFAKSRVVLATSACFRLEECRLVIMEDFWQLQFPNSAFLLFKPSFM
jgi:hypothetical protein